MDKVIHLSCNRPLVTKLKRENLTNEYNAPSFKTKSRVELSRQLKVQQREVESSTCPHKPVVRETAKTTKVRIVYDASAKEQWDSPSLNNCLYPGPPLQNKFWDVLIHQRGYAVMISGDIQKAFLQFRVRECERDALRFHWRSERRLAGRDVEIYKSVVWVGTLAGVIEQHLSSWEDKYPDLVAELRKSLYVDDLLTGGQTIAQAADRKDKAIEVFEDVFEDVFEEICVIISYKGIAIRNCYFLTRKRYLYILLPYCHS